MRERSLTKESCIMIRTVMGDSAGLTYTRLVYKWVGQSGVEWTVKRLKALRTGALQLRAGNPGIAKSLWQENSIAYNKSTLFPKGVVGKVVECYVRASRPSSLRRWDLVLRSYTSLLCMKLTHTQDKKSFDSITLGKPEGSDTDQKLFERIRSELKTLAGNIKVPQPKAPNLSRLRGNTSTHLGWNCSSLSKQERDAWYMKAVMSLCTSAYLPESLVRINPNEEFRQLLISAGADTTLAGHLAFIQEAGAKARVVAVPNAWIQWLMQPLHSTLDEIIQSYGCSCVHDQNNGAYFCQNKLAEGKTLYCFDLSSATDRFPLEWQTAVLEGLGLDIYAEAVQEISHSKWRFKTEFRDVNVSWCVGQPMGMYGSFPLFHLTHLLVTCVACYTAGFKQIQLMSQEAPFRILGDDIIISDPKVAKNYQILMSIAGVELSPTKTICSDRLAEFAGFVTTHTKLGPISYRGYKHKQDRTPKLFNMAFALGAKYTALKGVRYRKIDYFTFAKSLSLRNPDLSPMIPDEGEEIMKTPRLDSHLLGSHFNKCVERLCLNIDIDRLSWRQYREVFLDKYDPTYDYGQFGYSRDVERGPSGADLVISQSTKPIKEVDNLYTSYKTSDSDKTNVFG